MSVTATLDYSEACCEWAFHYESDGGFCCGIYPSGNTSLEILPNFPGGRVPASEDVYLGQLESNERRVNLLWGSD